MMSMDGETSKIHVQDKEVAVLIETISFMISQHIYIYESKLVVHAPNIGPKSLVQLNSVDDQHPHKLY